MRNIYNCCALCLVQSKNNGDDLINFNSMVLCQKCYDKYSSNSYEREIMPINSIRHYRKYIAEIKELIMDTTMELKHQEQLRISNFGEHDKKALHKIEALENLLNKIE